MQVFYQLKPMIFLYDPTEQMNTVLIGYSEDNKAKIQSKTNTTSTA